MKRIKRLPEGHGQVSWPEARVHRHGRSSQTIGLKRRPGQVQCLLDLRTSSRVCSLSTVKQWWGQTGQAGGSEGAKEDPGF